MKKLLLLLTSLFIVTGCWIKVAPTQKQIEGLIRLPHEHYRELTKEEKEDYKKRLEAFLNNPIPENEAKYQYTHIDGNVEMFKVSPTKKFTGWYEESISSRGHFLQYISFKDQISTEFAMKNNEIYTRSAKGAVGTGTKWDKISTQPTFKMYDLNIFYDLIKKGDVRFMFDIRSDNPVLVLDEKQASDILNHFLGINLNEVKEKELKKDKENTLEYIELDLISFVKQPMIEKGLFRGLFKIVFKYSEIHVDFQEYRSGKKDLVDFSKIQ